MDNIVLDTNVLMHHSDILDTLTKSYKVIIPIVVIEELDKLKMSQDCQKSHQARIAIKHIEEYMSTIECDMSYSIINELNCQHLNHHNDNIILSSAKRNNAYLYTLDINMRIKAEFLNIKLFSVDGKMMYRGYKKITMSNEDMQSLYDNMSCNIFDLSINEYLLIESNIDNSIVDVLKWNGNEYVRIPFYNIDTEYFGTIKPNDPFQLCAMDSMFRNEISVLYGKSGTGKTFLALTYLFYLLQKRKIDKIYIIHSYDTLRGAKTLGYEKGTHEDKILITSSIGNILATKLGSIDAVRDLIEKGELEIIPTANIRGAEFSDRTAVFVTEAQNLDVYTLKTIIQRCKAGTKQIYEGDIIEQKDVTIERCGIERMIEVFKNDSIFGCIKLKNNYRNRAAELADKM